MASTKFIPKCRVFANLKRRIHSLAEDGMHIIPNWGQNIECHKEATTTLFLGPRGPHGIPLLVSPSVRKKNLDHSYTGMYASCHESAEDF